MNPTRDRNEPPPRLNWLDHQAWLLGLKLNDSSAVNAIVVDLDDFLSADAIDVFSALLDGEDRERAARFRFKEDRNRFTVAHAVLRLVASHATGMAPEAIEFMMPRSGQPPRLVPGPGAMPTLSLSHAGPYVAVAIGRDRPVGIDLEQQRVLEDLDAVARTALTAAEFRDLATLHEDERHRVFLRWWTAKEAALKAHGIGLATAPDLVRLRYDSTHSPIAAFVPEDASTREYQISGFDPFGPSKAVVAIATSGCYELSLTSTTARHVLLWDQK